MTIITDEQIAYIKNGGVVAYPTSTLPGLGCIPTKEGLDTLFALKSRSSDKPVSLGVASLEQVVDLVEIDSRVIEFVEAFPRGSLTVIYPAKKTLDARLGGDAIAIRVFEHPAARALSEAVGPVTATSANEAGEEPASNVAEAAADLGLPDIAIIAGKRATGPGSTFVKIDLSSDEPLVTIMREGIVPSRDVVTWWKNRH
ncbi:MAG: Threonylcarbamoyl-AMP synthase [Euryarchaeota archaeon UBA443]|jgi:L-threonylcarbamoyladenylate synthase|nr:MAG: Threonylcarbamoyl-AMP synthase [Euryarchaeota archaeon UBA443]